MNRRQRRGFLVGIFVILGLSLFILAIYVFGKKEYFIGSPVKVSAIFNDVKGLTEGDKVRLSGIDIGTVSSLSFMNDNRVLVQMSIDREKAEFLKSDSRVTIGNEGLMGSKVVTMVPGNPDSPGVAEFDTLATLEQVDINDILVQVNRSSENIAVVSEQLVDITQKINRGDGIFGKIFTDTTLTRNLDDATKNISFLTQNLNELSEKVSSGQGIVGKLFADTTLTEGIGNTGAYIEEMSANLRDITEQINKGEGIFGRMFTDTSLTNNLFLTSKNLQETSSSLMVLADKLNNDSSALSMLIDDPVFADSLQLLINRINTGVIEATEAADAVQRSGLIRLFSKKKEKAENTEETKKPVQPGD